MMRWVFRIVKSCIAIALLPVATAVLPSFAADSPVLEVPVELWDRPRSGRNVIAVPAIREAVSQLTSRPDSKVTIRHAPGPDPVLQAEEIKAWLMAHAVAPGRIALHADSNAGRTIRLEISSAARQ
ncbi:MAG: hypothetical protein EHM59_07840 [Betaproteobacteria bacterium]|nr:MAG: hypothetical protein EHM59_07840 [Betaproteobacteria bacterium]